MTAHAIGSIPGVGNETAAPPSMGRLLAAFLGEQHGPHHTAKLVGAEIRRVTGETVNGETLKAWVQGRAWPANERHLRALFQTYGAALGLYVFGHDWRAAEQRIAAEEAAQRARLDAAKADRRAFLGLD